MGPKVSLGVLHLLLQCKAIHIIHQGRCHLISLLWPLAALSTTMPYPHDPASVLAAMGATWAGISLSSEGHGFSILILRQVNLLQYLPLSEVLHR